MAETRESLARWLCNRAHNSAYVWDSGHLSGSVKEYWLREADAAIAAQQSGIKSARLEESKD